MQPVIIEHADESLAALKNRAAMIAAGLVSGTALGGFLDEASAQLGTMKLNVAALADHSVTIALKIELIAEAAWKARRDEVARVMARLER